MIHIEGLTQQNDAKVRLIDYDIQGILKQMEQFGQKAFHFQMVGLLIIFGSLPLLSTFHLSGMFPFPVFVLFSCVAIGIGIGFVFVFYNASIFSKLDKRYADLTRITASLLNLKSIIYGYYITNPDNEMVFRISMFQDQYYNALLVLTLDSFKELRDDRFMKKFKKEFQNTIDVLTENAIINLKNNVELETTHFDIFIEEIKEARKTLDILENKMES